MQYKIFLLNLNIRSDSKNFKRFEIPNYFLKHSFLETKNLKVKHTVKL